MPSFIRLKLPGRHSPSGEGAAISASGPHLRQARRVKPGTLRPRNVDDWLAEHLDEAEPLVPRLEHPGYSLPLRSARGGRVVGGSGLSLTQKLGVGVVVCAILAVTVTMAGVLGHQAEAVPTAEVPTAASHAPSTVADASATDPGSPSASASGTAAPMPTAGRSLIDLPDSVFFHYQVVRGDTLIRIARSFGLSTTTLYWANSTSISNPNLIYAGQTLLVPPVDGVVHMITADDTLNEIADKYGIDPQVITDANELLSPTLIVGQPLLLPGVPNKPLPRALEGMKPVDWLNKLAWPVPSSHNITLAYGCTGYKAEPRFGSCRHWHDAIDVGARWGVPVVAAASGTVIYAGKRKSGMDGAAGGIVVWISHGGTLYTTYNHLSGVTVKAGQKVVMGDQVGRIGQSGAADGSHLHFEVWTDYPWTGGKMTDAKNPILYLKWKPS